MANKFASKERAEQLRKQYLAGTRIELLSMEDPYSKLQPGDRGFVTFVDDTGTVFVDWDKGSGLGLVYGEDSYRKITEPQNEIGIGVCEETDAPVPETPAEPSEAERNFTAWLAVTESSRHQWVEDEICCLNGHGSMYYTGGGDGIYVRIRKDGLVEAGHYEGAIPHIGEATFRPDVTRQFPSYSDAFAAVMEAGGRQFLANMFDAGEPQPSIKLAPSL